MAKVTVLPSGETIELEPGESVRDGLFRLGIELETPCNGEGVCGQCGVWVENPETVPETPHERISAQQSQKGLRLACRLSPDHDITIHVPPEISYDRRRILGNAGVPAPSLEEIPEGHIKTYEYHYATGAAVFQKDGIYWIHHYVDAVPGKLEIWESNFEPKGLAVDLGTTTIVLTLVSLISGEELGTASILNPQIKYGHDVMTRIHKGSTPEGIEQLSQAVRDGVNRLLMELCSDLDSDPLEIVDVVIGGNTTMLQLAAMIDPAPLGRMPFIAGIKGGESFPVEQFGFEVNPAARVYVPPVAHAFVGSDVSAGLLVCENFFDTDHTTLFVDAGTNGELGLSAHGKWLVTSTAAGPAFEGMGISHGMRAGVGAIEAVFVAGESILYGTVGNAPARGICGSGIIDLVACLLKLDVIEKSGRMRRPSNSNGIPETVAACMEEIDGFSAFKVAEGVHFTQEDVRDVQLAKGAIRAAIDLFLHETGTSPELIDTIVLAGGFGYSLEPESLETIGMIPPGMADKVHFAGNTSRLGCVRLLLDVGERRRIEERMSQVEHISLAERVEFMEQYVENMRFPDLVHHDCK